MLSIPERIGGFAETLRKAGDNVSFMLRVAVPAIIQSFDKDKQTITAIPAIREKLTVDGKVDFYEIPLLLDVPIVLPRGGPYTMTFPIQKGDECLVIFGDNCIDSWWQSGGIQNPIGKRRHDLSDGFAILSCWSQPRVIANYSTDSVQLRNEAGDAYIELKEKTINIVTTEKVNITTTDTVNIGSGDVVINSKVFLDHVHKNGGGIGNSGGVA